MKSNSDFNHWKKCYSLGEKYHQLQILKTSVSNRFLLRKFYYEFKDFSYYVVNICVKLAYNEL